MKPNALKKPTGNSIREDRPLRAAVLVLLLALSPAVAWSWGKTGHRLINKNAVLLLPDPLKSFYQRNLNILEREATAPDDWKKEDRGEAPRHFINIDLLEAPPFPGFPMTYEQALQKYGKKQLKETGTLPWRIEEYAAKLETAFREGNRRKIAEVSAHLGHYVGDAYQPLHVTVNHDGQWGTTRGFHHLFESKMVDKYVKEFRFNAKRPVQAVPDIPKFIMEGIRETYAELHTVKSADLRARGDTPKRSRTYLKTLYGYSGDVAWRRIQRGSEGLAAIWLTAWTRAGKPYLP